jgi:uncharacterized protein
MSETVASDGAMTRIVLRPLGTVLPLGLFVFGVGMLLLGALGFGWIPQAQAKGLGIVLVAFVFPFESAAGLIAFYARDPLGGTVLSVFGGSWLALGLTHILLPPETTRVLAFFLVGFAAVVASLAAVASLAKPLLAAILTVSSLRAALDAAYQFSSSRALEHAAAGASLALAALALYAGLAFLLEDARRRPVLPTLRRGSGRAAVDADVASQVRVAESQPGVRQQL